MDDFFSGEIVSSADQVLRYETIEDLMIRESTSIGLLSGGTALMISLTIITILHILRR